MHSFCIATTNHSNNNNQLKYGKKNLNIFSVSYSNSYIHALYAYTHTNSFLYPKNFIFLFPALHYITHFFLVDSKRGFTVGSWTLFLKEWEKERKKNSFHQQSTL